MEWNTDLSTCAGQNIYYFVHTNMINMQCHFNDHSRMKKQNSHHLFDRLIFNKVSVKSKSFFSPQF